MESLKSLKIQPIYLGEFESTDTDVRRRQKEGVRIRLNTVDVGGDPTEFFIIAHSIPAKRGCFRIS